MPRDRRQKAQDVFNQSQPFLGKTDSFEKAHPSIAELALTVTEEGDEVWRGMQTRTYGKHDFGEYINCSNPRCYNGGFHIGEILRSMTDSLHTRWSGTRSCQGYEGSPKGRINRGPCGQLFRIEVEIIYR